MIYDRLGIDVWEVIDAAKTKPFGFHAVLPGGPGWAGTASRSTRSISVVASRGSSSCTRRSFIELAGEINASMPEYVVTRLAEALNSVGKPIQGSKIGVLGVAYKKDVDDPRESPAYKVMELLNERGADLSYSDPHIPKMPPARRFNVLPLKSIPLTAEYLGSLDCALIITDHTAFDAKLIVEAAPLVVDTRNLTAGVRRAGGPRLEGVDPPARRGRPGKEARAAIRLSSG